MKNNSANSRILIAAILLSCSILFGYYLFFLQKFFTIPLSFSFKEGINLGSVGEGPLYADLIRGNFFSARQLNLVALLLIFSGLLSFAAREKLKWFSTICAFLVFISFTSTQDYFIQARPHLLATGIGLIGLHFGSQNASNFFKKFISALLITLPIALFISLPAYSFALTLALNPKIDKRQTALIVIFASIFTLLGWESLYHSGVSGWSPLSFFNSFSPIYAWGLVSFLALFYFVQLSGGQANTPNQITANLFLKLSILSSLLCFIETGIHKAESSGAWLITIASLCGLLMIHLNSCLTQNESSPTTKHFLSILIILIAGLTPFLKTELIHFIDENNKLIIETQNWMREKKSQNNILSQDLLIAKQTGNQKSLINSAKPSLRSGLLRNIERQKYEQIVMLSSLPSSVWPTELIKAIKANYLPIKKLFINGKEGYLYEPKGISYVSNSDEESYRSENIFATFHET